MRYAARKTEDNPDGATKFDILCEEIADAIWAATGLEAHPALVEMVAIDIMDKREMKDDEPE